MGSSPDGGGALTTTELDSVDPFLAPFDQADPDGYRWRTRHPAMAARERALLEEAFLPLRPPVLDVGCGEGVTFFHLGDPADAVGVDTSPAKIAFAAERGGRARFEVASAYRLPFPDGAFGQVIARDLLHHLHDAERAIDEIARVLPRGGRLDLLEPSIVNPLILAQAACWPSERGLFGSRATRLAGLLAPSFELEAVRRFEALPLARLVYHPRLGWPELAGTRWIAHGVAAVERLAERALPAQARAYLHLRATRR